MTIPGYDLFGSIFNRGDIVFQEGEQGEAMYIIQSGAVEVTKTVEGREIVLAQLEHGDFFGEMALIDNRPRSATVKTLCKSRLLPLSKKSLLARIPEDTGIVLHILGTLSRRIAVSNRLKQISFKDDETLVNEIVKEQDSIHDTDRHTFSHKPVLKNEIISQDSYNSIFSTLHDLESVEFDAGEFIFRQGDQGQEIYVITEGTVEINMDDENPLILAILTPGDCVGEMALISDNRRSATAVAIEKTKAVKIDRQSFFKRLRTTPGLALSIIQLMILRLRRTINKSSSLDDETEVPGIILHPLLNKDRRVRLSFLSLSACSGCVINILEEQKELADILEMTHIVYSPMLMDDNEIGHTDIAVIDGAVRTREEREILEEIRNKSRYVVAWGTCAAFTGVPSYANSFELEDLIDETYGQAEDPYAHYLSGKPGVGETTYRNKDLALLRKAGKLDDFIRADFYLPGCPPRINLLANLIRELRGKKKDRDESRVVCSECSRKRSKCTAQSLYVFSDQENDKETCFNSQGIICLGFLTRGRCGAPCPDGGFPCWGCRGPSDVTLNKLKSGISFDHLLTYSLQKTCNLPHEKVTPAINVLISHCLSMSNFDHYFIYDPERIR